MLNNKITLVYLMYIKLIIVFGTRTVCFDIVSCVHIHSSRNYLRIKTLDQKWAYDCRGPDNASTVLFHASGHRVLVIAIIMIAYTVKLIALVLLSILFCHTFIPKLRD